MISLGVLGAVLVLIAVRRIGSLRLKIWQIMLGGAVAVVATGEMPLHLALAAIQMDVMLFLFGMFVLGRAMEVSGYLTELSFRLFRRAHTTDGLVLYVLFGMGIGSALLMNDTLAIVGTPVVLHLARHHGLPPVMLLLTLCFGVTIGSVMSPIGNPQNLLIAVEGRLENPFVLFLVYLGIPTLLNILVAYGWLRFQFRGAFHARPLLHEREWVHDAQLTRWARMGGAVVLGLVAVKIVLALLGADVEIPLTAIALAGAAPVLVCSRRRVEILRTIDWATLVFFAAMFVLMGSVWETGAFQKVAAQMALDVSSVPVVMALGVGLSQVISNVPLVALYLPLLLSDSASIHALMALAAGSTIAGNLFVLGAASNVIAIQNAELRGEHSLTFWAFARSGIPVTALNVLVYMAWFALW